MTTKRGWKWLFKDTWTPEITVSVFSWAMFATIIFLLSSFKNEPIRHDISLNFLVSALATLSKTSLLFTVSTCLGQWKYIEFSRYSPSLVRFATLDEASRGPQGSFILLWQSRLRSFASFGAIVVIISLFVDPFLQRVIKLAEQQMDNPRDSSTVPRAMRYSKGNDIKFLINTCGEPLTDSTARDQNSADYSMQAAVSLGISSSMDEIPKVSAYYPSASCKWPLFSTLAVCSSCSDISDKLKLKRYTNDTRLPQMLVIGTDRPGVESNDLTSDYEVFELPNGLSIQKTEEREIRMVTKGSMNWTETVTAKDDPSNIWALTVLKRTIPDQDDFLATECILNYCVKNIVSSFEAGILRENSMRIEQKIIPGSFDSSRPDIRPWSDLCVDGNPDFAFDGGYNVSHTAAKSISRHMKRTFSDWESEYSQNWTKSWGTTGFYKEFYDVTKFRPDSMQAIYDSSNITAMFEAIAASMTNNIRANDDSHTLVYGTSSSTVYQIRWNWLILPIINQVVGTFFFVFVIYSTKRYRVPLWKSSALAIMKCGSLTTALLETAETLAEMEARAKGERFTISRNDIKKQEKEYSASEQDDTLMGHEVPRLSISLERQNLSLSNMITNELDHRWVAIDSENR